MKVVSNATPLIALAATGRFDLLRKLFGRIEIADAVYREIVTQGRGRPGAKEVAAANWVNNNTVKDKLAVEILLDDLDAGEVQTIVLAKEMKADLVLMDERLGRKKLKQLGIKHIGTLGVLIKAHELGLIDDLKGELFNLSKSRFNIKPSLVRQILNAIGKKTVKGR